MYTKPWRYLILVMFLTAFVLVLQTTPVFGDMLEGSFQVNEGSGYTNQQQVTLSFSNANNIAAGTYMRLKNEGEPFSQWMPFQNGISWQLSPGDGPKTITVEMNFMIILSRAYTATVALDTQPPAIHDINVIPLSNSSAVIRWRTSEPALSFVRSDTGPFNKHGLQNGGPNRPDNYTLEHRARLNNLRPNRLYRLKIEAIDRANNHTISAEFPVSTRPADQIPPTGSIRINGGAPFTSDPQVDLELTANDDSGPVATMSFSDDGLSWSPDEPFAHHRHYMLPGGDGRKTVYVRFRDQAGNYSQAYSDSITLDGRPFQITDINVFPLPGNAVEIRWRTSKPSFGTVLYNAAFHNYALRGNENDGGFQRDFAIEHSIRISRLEPGKTYFAKIEAVDQIGNHFLSQEFSFAARTFDQVPPTGSIRINGGAPFTNNPQVVLQLAASDNESGVTSMSFSNDGRRWSPEEPFRSEKPYTLPGGDGPKNVFVRYRDQAGNYSPAYSDGTLLDTRPPQISNVTVNQVNRDMVEIRWHTDEPAFGLVQYNAEVRNYLQRSNDNRADFQGNFGTDHLIRIGLLLPGRIYYGRIDVVDRAGNHNLSPEFSFNIPVGPVAPQQPPQPPQPAQNWLGWQKLPDGQTPSGAAAIQFNGKLQVLVRGTDNHIYLKTGLGPGWTEIGGATNGSPTLEAFEGSLCALVQGTDNGIYVNRFNGSWSGWTNIGGSTLSGGALVSYNGILYAFVRGTDNGIYVNQMNNGKWSGWSNIGGATNAEPAAATFQGRLYLAVRGTDDKVYLRSLSGSSWDNWREVPGDGRILSGPSLINYQNRLWIVGRGTDNRIYLNVSNLEGAFNGWAQLPGNGMTDGKPETVIYQNELYLIVKGTDNNIYWNKYH